MLNKQHIKSILKPLDLFLTININKINNIVFGMIFGIMKLNSIVLLLFLIGLIIFLKY